MVGSISALSSAAQGEGYYETDDTRSRRYYSESGTAQGEWRGSGAQLLGLSGGVDRAPFGSLLRGNLPNGVVLGTVRDGVRQHRPGWDITFSAPKSVSVMALVADDRRLVEAHRQATAAAYAYIEEHAALTRVRSLNGVEAVHTDNLVIATFEHQTTRALDPQLHTHGVILNATMTEDGTWRSLESLALFDLTKDAGAIYRHELARHVRALGYEISERENSTFEIVGLPENALSEFSQRSQQIEKALAERGKTRTTATAKEKAVIALDTRDRKVAVELTAISAQWRDRAAGIGFGRKQQQDLISARKAWQKLQRPEPFHLRRESSASARHDLRAPQSSAKPVRRNSAKSDAPK
jgi:conjugative relaxase-like TrwC/TraI family protein